MQHDVSSNFIKRLSLDSDVLTVEFKNGHVSTYSGVSEREYHELRNAESVGRHFNKYIRGVKEKV